MENGHQLVDLFDKEQFQTLQDNFAKALDLGFITVDYRGRPILKYSGFTGFCNKIRKREECLSLCYQCDAHGGLHATITGEPYIYRCHAGLVDFAVPLILEGKYMGSVMGGQVELIGDAPEIKPILTQSSNWQDDPELLDEINRVHKVTYEKLVSSVYLLRDMMQRVMEDQYRQISAKDLQEKERELREEKAARISLEEDMKNSNELDIRSYLGSEFTFYILNIIAKLAYREHASETEDAACNYAAMLRYLYENNNNSFVTIGDEIEYIEYYLRIQKYRLEERLQYEVVVPDELLGVLCPFMLLQPIVENSIKYAVETSRAGGKLAIHGRAEGGICILGISDSGTGMSRQQIRTLLDLAGDGSGKKSKFDLTNANLKIKELFGDECGIDIQSKEDGFPGTEVQIRLPIKN